MVALAPSTQIRTARPARTPAALTRRPQPSVRTPSRPTSPDEELRRAITAAQILRGAPHPAAAQRADEIMNILRLGIELSEEERAIINDALRSV
ncbi:MAG: hypothetical protein JJU33_11610 [Phycisphaerales bacterium]|nr:hypothetical protein [Phycisphaerales bacterium]